MHILQCISTACRQALGKAFTLHLHLQWSNLLFFKVFNRIESFFTIFYLIIVNLSIKILK